MFLLVTVVTAVSGDLWRLSDDYYSGSHSISGEQTEPMFQAEGVVSDEDSLSQHHGSYLAFGRWFFFVSWDGSRLRSWYFNVFQDERLISDQDQSPTQVSEKKQNKLKSLRSDIWIKKLCLCSFYPNVPNFQKTQKKMWKFLYPSPAVNKRAKPDGNLSGCCVNVRKVTIWKI